MTLKVKQLNYRIGSKQLLKDISLSIEQPQLIGVVGANGAGKSTLLNCLSGLYHSNHKVELNGCPIESYNQLELAKQRAFLTQDNSLNFPFLARQIVAMSFALSAISIERQQQIIEQCLAITGSEQLADRQFLELSGGERQRVHIARVLAQLLQHKSDQTRYLFLDEPTAPLDLKHQFLLLDYLKTLHQQNIVVIIILHDLNLAAAYCEHIWLMKDSQIIKNDCAEKALTVDHIHQAYEVSKAKIKSFLNFTITQRE